MTTRGDDVIYYEAIQPTNCCDNETRLHVPHNGEECAFGGSAYVRRAYCEHCHTSGDRARPRREVGQRWRWWKRARVKSVKAVSAGRYGPSWFKYEVTP